MHRQPPKIRGKSACDDDEDRCRLFRRHLFDIKLCSCAPLRFGFSHYHYASSAPTAPHGWHVTNPSIPYSSPTQFPVLEKFIPSRWASNVVYREHMNQVYPRCRSLQLLIAVNTRWNWSFRGQASSPLAVMAAYPAANKPMSANCPPSQETCHCRLCLFGTNNNCVDI